LRFLRFGRRYISGGESAAGALLDRLDGGSLSAETIRQIRAVEALEAIASSEARRLLEKLAAGPAETRLAAEAKAAARRLSKRAGFAP
jgi:hypothetical protein